MDIGFGNTAQRHLILASRIIPIEGFLTTGGAALPVDPAAGRRILRVEEDEADPRDLRLQANLPLAGGRACRTRDSNLSLLGDVIPCRLCGARWSNPLADWARGSSTPRKERSRPCGSGKTEVLRSELV